jgi:phosphoglycolate phosphatase-like HAD superfamily hydrolase
VLQHMRDAGLRLAVASSAEEDELEKLLEIAGVTDLIEKRTSINAVEHSKPAPDSIQVALEQLGLEPSEAVMIGDTPYDIEAATGAGVATIAFRCGGWNDADLKGATAIYDAPADLFQNFDDSPLGPGPVGG